MEEAKYPESLPEEASREPSRDPSKSNEKERKKTINKVLFTYCVLVLSGPSRRPSALVPSPRRRVLLRVQMLLFLEVLLLLLWRHGHGHDHVSSSTSAVAVFEDVVLQRGIGAPSPSSPAGPVLMPKGAVKGAGAASAMLELEK